MSIMIFLCGCALKDMVIEDPAKDDYKDSVEHNQAETKSKAKTQA